MHYLQRPTGQDESLQSEKHEALDEMLNNFTMQPIMSARSALQMQMREAVEIGSTPQDNLLNLKEEYNP